MNSPVGELKLVASNMGLVALLWENDKPLRVRLGEVVASEAHPILTQAEQQLNEYFAGTRTSFSVPVDLRGTSFQMNVWEALLAIPFGGTRTYGDLAQQFREPASIEGGWRGDGKNPISIIVPCHRVIGSTGKLTGFAGGLETKAHLLELEQERLSHLHRCCIPKPESQVGATIRERQPSNKPTKDTHDL
jgi:methylated-DNA-[protein]-cysteine S-methyltransferase